MNVRYSKELPQAFVVGASELEEVVTLLEEHIGEVYIQVKCSDDLSRNFETVKELIGYKNPKSKEILRIYLIADSDDYSKSAGITFVHSTWSGILIDYKGSEDTVSRLKEETLDIIAGMHPWYGVMYRINFLNPVWIVLGILLVVGFSFSFFILFLALGWVPAVPEVNRRDLMSRLRSIRIVLLIPQVIFFVIAVFSNKILKSFFPKAVFTIGQGKSRFEHQEKVRWVVIIGFWVSLAASLVVPIVMSIF